MTDHKLHATWGPIPDRFPAGNDWLRAEGSPIRHYLNHSDGRWHLGTPTELDYVPYATLSPYQTSEERYAAAVAPRRRPNRILAWLDADAHRRLPVPRLVLILGALAAGLFVAGVIVTS